MPVYEYLLTVTIQQQKGSSWWGGRMGHLPVGRSLEQSLAPPVHMSRFWTSSFPWCIGVCENIREKSKKHFEFSTWVNRCYIFYLFLEVRDQMSIGTLKVDLCPCALPSLTKEIYRYMAARSILLQSDCLCSTGRLKTFLSHSEWIGVAMAAC